MNRLFRPDMKVSSASVGGADSHNRNDHGEAPDGGILLGSTMSGVRGWTGAISMSRVVFTAMQVLVLALAEAAGAASVTYTLRAPCVSLSGIGCNVVGLGEGDSVIGRLTFDESLVVPGDRFNFDASTPGVLGFSITAGNLTVSTSDLAPSPPAVNVVAFSQPDAAFLSAIGIASISLGFGPPLGGTISVNSGTVNFTGTSASGTGNWRADGPWVVPEPSTAFLMGLGLVGLASRRR